MMSDDDRAYKEALKLLESTDGTMVEMPFEAVCERLRFYINKCKRLETKLKDHRDSWGSLKNSCGHSKRYKGIRAPKCNGGKGCKTCWTKYILNFNADVEKTPFCW